MNKSEYASSQHEEQPAANDRIIRKPFPPEPLTIDERERLKRLADLPEDQINTDDTPELSSDTPYIFNPYLPASSRLKKAS